MTFKFISLTKTVNRLACKLDADAFQGTVVCTLTDVDQVCIY